MLGIEKFLTFVHYLMENCFLLQDGCGGKTGYISTGVVVRTNNKRGTSKTAKEGTEETKEKEEEREKSWT